MVLYPMTLSDLYNYRYFKPTHFIHLESIYISSQPVKIEITNLAGRLLTESQVPAKDDKSPLKGRGQGHLTILNFGSPNHISGMAAARVIKFCT